MSINANDTIAHKTVSAETAEICCASPGGSIAACGYGKISTVHCAQSGKKFMDILKKCVKIIRVYFVRDRL